MVTKGHTEKFIIWSAAIVTLVISAFPNYSLIPGYIKIFYALIIWVDLILVLQLSRNKRRDKTLNIVLSFVIVIALFSIIKAIIEPYTGVGNKWTSLFGNDTCALMLLAPLFAWLSFSKEAIISLKKVSFFFIIVGLLMFLTIDRFPYKVLWIASAFYFYSKKKEKLFIFLFIAVMIYRGFFIEETSRTGVLLVAVVIASYLIAFVVKRRLLVEIFCILMVSMPIIYSIMTIIISDYSFFDIILPKVADYTKDDVLTTDTRSFLFKELATDLTVNDAWLLGKGAVSQYYSAFFSTSTGDSAIRFNSEVTMLQLLLRGGILYAIAYYAFIIIGIIRGLKKSNSRFLLFICVLASGWIMITCISDLSGCSFIQIGFFILLGTCYSRFWLNCSDAEVRKYLELR